VIYLRLRKYNLSTTPSGGKVYVGLGTLVIIIILLIIIL
jgi:hypothetical protein